MDTQLGPRERRALQRPCSVLEEKNRGTPGEGWRVWGQERSSGSGEVKRKTGELKRTMATKENVHNWSEALETEILKPRWFRLI